MTGWTEEQKQSVINHAMDLCANVDKFRTVLILTMSDEGEMGVVEKRWDNASSVEVLGMYRTALASVEDEEKKCWRENERPLAGDE